MPPAQGPTLLPGAFERAPARPLPPPSWPRRLGRRGEARDPGCHLGAAAQAWGGYRSSATAGDVGATHTIFTVSNYVGMEAL